MLSERLTNVVVLTLFVVLAMLYALGCAPNTCLRNSECPPHFTCGEEGMCVVAPVHTSTPSTSDGGDGGSATDGGGVIDGDVADAASSD
jgi:hypothetical protein